MEITLAVIAAFAVIMAGVPSALIERARRENADDHASVRRRLDRIDEHLDEIEDSVDDVATTLVDHLNWHNKEAPDERHIETAGNTKESTSPDF